MDIYFDTYEEAAAVEGCEVVLTTGPNWVGGRDYKGKFVPTTKVGGEYCIPGKPKSFYSIGDNAWIIATPPKPRKTKVTYELVTDLTNNEIAKAMIDGEVFYNQYGGVSYSWNDGRFESHIGSAINIEGNFYRRIEKPVEWWEDLDSLKYPIPLKHTPSGSITSWDRDDIEDNLELDEIPDNDYFKINWRPATREEVQQLLDNVWEG